MEFLAQTNYATMFFWAVLTYLEKMAERKKKERTFSSTRPAGFAASKNIFLSPSHYIVVFDCRGIRPKPPRVEAVAGMMPPDPEAIATANF